MQSADELGVAGAQPLPNTALPTPSPMPSLAHAPNTALPHWTDEHAPNTALPHWTDEHTSPEAEAHARAVLGDAQGYAGCSPPQPTHHGQHPMCHGQQALSSPAVQTYYAQQAYKQQAYSQQALYPPPEPPPAEVPAPCWATAATAPRRRHHPDEPLPRPRQRSTSGSYALTTARGCAPVGAPTAAGGVGGMLLSDENLDTNLGANLGELLSVEPLSRPLSRTAPSTAPARVRPSMAGAAGTAGGTGGARSGTNGTNGTGGHAFTGRVHRGNPFRKAAELSGQPATHPSFGPPPDAHTLVIQGGAQLGAPTELSRSREVREGAPPLPITPANSSLLKDYLMQRGQAAATQAASERWK